MADVFVVLFSNHDIKMWPAARQHFNRGENISHCLVAKHALLYTET